jgi:hypothetical protein
MTEMECVALDSSNSPPPPSNEAASGIVSSSSSSVEGSLALYIGSATSGAGACIKKQVSDSDSVSSSGISSSSSEGDFLSKYLSSEVATLQPSAPTARVAVSAAADASISAARKEPKASYRTTRYFDEADASIT